MKKKRICESISFFFFSFFNLGILCHFVQAYYYCCYFLRGYYIRFVPSFVVRTRTFFRSLRSFQLLFFFLQPVFSEFSFSDFCSKYILTNSSIYVYVQENSLREDVSLRRHTFSHISSVQIHKSGKVENHEFFCLECEN